MPVQDLPITESQVNSWLIIFGILFLCLFLTSGLKTRDISVRIHTVLAAGGGAVTKLKSPYENKIDRIFNFKYPYEYISRFDEQSERKKHIYNFYEMIKSGN